MKSLSCIGDAAPSTCSFEVDADAVRRELPYAGFVLDCAAGAASGVPASAPSGPVT